MSESGDNTFMSDPVFQAVARQDTVDKLITPLIEQVLDVKSQVATEAGIAIQMLAEALGNGFE